MKSGKILVAMLLAGTFFGCSKAPKAPDVSDNIRKSLEQANLKDVSVSEDRDKGVVTLSGKVATDADKAQAESIAKAQAAGQIVADQIAVIPPNDASAAKTVNADLDKGIEKNLHAALTEKRLQKSVKYDVKNGVVTLKGKVNTESQRTEAESVSSSVPNVTQVVNELQVKNQASTTKHPG